MVRIRRSISHPPPRWERAGEVNGQIILGPPPPLLAHQGILHLILHPYSLLAKAKYIWERRLVGLEDLEGFPGGSVVKNLLANAGDTSSIPGPGRSHMKPVHHKY